MRYLWQNAHKIPDQPDMNLAREACAVAAQCAPYMHPRLASVDAKIDVDISTQLTEEQRRERARLAILSAFAERPTLTAPAIIEHDPDDDTTRQSTEHYATPPHATARHATPLSGTTNGGADGGVGESEDTKPLLNNGYAEE